jgi:hypothetical protein
MNDRSLFETGLEIRRDVLGADHVDTGLAEADGVPSETDADGR